MTATSPNIFELTMDISVVFVNWNSREYLRTCLESLYRHTSGVLFEVIVVDNHSPEGGIEQIASSFPDVQILKSEVNLGFAGANNLGCHHARGEYVLFLNPDTELTGNVLAVMYGHLRRLPNAGILGCRLLNTDGTLQTSCIQTFPTIVNQLLDIEALRIRYPACPLWNIAPLYAQGGVPVSVEVISGACMMMRRDVFERAGSFSEDYFMYAEDLDLCYKVKRLGLNNYYAGDATVIHHGGKSSGQADVSQWSTIMKARAVQKFCAKVHGRLYGWAYRLVMACAAIVRLAVIACVHIFASRTGPHANSSRAAWNKWRAILCWAAGWNSTSVRTAENG
jgi:GT2 family glycosyltransferase